MDFADHYLIKLDLFMSIPADQVLQPGSEPVHVFLHEAETLYFNSLEDIELLLSGGLCRELVDDLPARISALREAESLWIASQLDEAKVKQFRAEKIAKARTFRDRLLRTLRFVHGDTKNLMYLHSYVKQFKGNATLVQSLWDLAAAGRKLMPDKPDSIITLELLDKTVEIAISLSAMLAHAATEDLKGSRALK